MAEFVLPARDLGNNPPGFKSPGQQCDAESLGFSFDWVPVKPPIYVVPSGEPPPACGTDAGF
jgi:hypothetical protein